MAAYDAEARAHDRGGEETAPSCAHSGQDAFDGPIAGRNPTLIALRDPQCLLNGATMQWLPAHEAHAIERVSLTFHFAEALPAKPFQVLLEQASSIIHAAGFSGGADEHELSGGPQVTPLGGPGIGFQISIGPRADLGMTTAPKMVVAGRTFQMHVDGQLREEIELRRSHFVHTSQIYGGWEAHRSRVMSLIGESLNRALPLTNLAAIKMEYWDRFVFDGLPMDAVYGDLLQLGSRYLPNFPRGSNQLWHSHVGFFVPGADRRLVNINVDAVDVTMVPAFNEPPGPPQQRRSVGLYTLVQDSIAPAASPGNAEGTISTLEALHTTLKEEFAAVITAEAADRISLKARAHS